MTRPVVILGDANVDLVIQLPDRSKGVPDLSRSEPQLFGGGTSANTAVALARLGVPVTFIGAVGDDGYGRWIADDFRREGVNTVGLRTLRGPFTPMVLALVEPDGERYLVVWPPRGGAHTRLQPADLDDNLIASAAWLHTTGMCLRDSPVRETVLRALRIARAAGVPTSLDLNLRLELWGWGEAHSTIEQAVELANVVFGSGDEEIVPLTSEITAETAALALAADQRTVVARLGADGALAAFDGQTIRVPAFPANPVNTVGAGDAFDGGFIAARLDGRSLPEALRWGNAVAALKIQRSGTRDLPTRAQVEALLA